ncbi:MAG: helix-turn-helix domain-containing protein [Vulcanimicrobiaceae bacterium]
MESRVVAMSAREAQRVYGIPITSLRTLAALGHIKSFRYGPTLGRVRFLVDSIEEYIERHMRPYGDRLEQRQRRHLRAVK